jgi:hypothetical protein
MTVAFPRSLTRTLIGVLVGALVPVTVVVAKISPDKAAELDGPKLTCMGAERAGSPSGIPEYSGKWVGQWPGMKGKFGYEPGPYADEKPQFTITSANMAQYADKLTEGQKALLKKYPTYKVNVYPSHRDFGVPDWACETTKKNAVTSELVDDGRGVTGIGGGPTFPIPQNGLEVIWSNIVSYRAWTEESVCDIANVYSNGSVAWGRQHFRTMNRMMDPSKRLKFEDEKINAYFNTAYSLPERDKGYVAVGFQPNNFAKDATQAWQYLPGTRRVRQAPEIGFDYPVPPAGARTVDDDYGFNGSPERYTWKLVGKKEMYVPYNNFKVNDPAVTYKQLITPSIPNSDYLRYELHRVWVLEANLKDGVRHIYKKRQMYLDEDSWQVLWVDNYDGRDQLWRISLITYHYSQESSGYHRGASFYIDMISGGYEGGYLVNERGKD